MAKAVFFPPGSPERPSKKNRDEEHQLVKAVLCISVSGPGVYYLIASPQRQNQGGLVFSPLFTDEVPGVDILAKVTPLVSFKPGGGRGRGFGFRFS